MNKVVNFTPYFRFPRYSADIYGSRSFSVCKFAQDSQKDYPKSTSHFSSKNSHFWVTKAEKSGIPKDTAFIFRIE